MAEKGEHILLVLSPRVRPWLQNGNRNQKMLLTAGPRFKSPYIIVPYDTSTSRATIRIKTILSQPDHSIIIITVGAATLRILPNFQVTVYYGDCVSDLWEKNRRQSRGRGQRGLSIIGSLRTGFRGARIRLTSRTIAVFIFYMIYIILAEIFEP